VVEHLPSKCKALSSNPSNHQKKKKKRSTTKQWVLERIQRIWALLVRKDNSAAVDSRWQSGPFFWQFNREATWTLNSTSGYHPKALKTGSRSQSPKGGIKQCPWMDKGIEKMWSTHTCITFHVGRNEILTCPSRGESCDRSQSQRTTSECMIPLTWGTWRSHKKERVVGTKGLGGREKSFNLGRGRGFGDRRQWHLNFSVINGTKPVHIKVIKKVNFPLCIF
jgi:hypothetical protein